MEMTIGSAPDPAKPLAVAVLSGDQVWPNIESIWHWSRVGGAVPEVYVYHPHDESSIHGPAQRLCRLLERQFQGIRVVVQAASPEASPQEARTVVQGWMAQNPGRRWLLNVTAGSRPLALGWAGLAGAPDVQVVYRAPSGRWFEWTRPAENGLPEAQLLPAWDPCEVDALPVDELVRSQIVTTADALDSVFEAATPLPVKRLTQEAIVQAWNWPGAFAACGLPAAPTAAVLFEQYVAAALKEMGLTGLARSLRLTNKRDRREKYELDLVAHRAGKILALDLELANESQEQQGLCPPLVAQLRQAADLQQRLAGLEARVIVVRPCRAFSEVERDLARAYRLEVIDQRDAPRLFSRLASLLGIPALPDEIAQTEALLVEQVTQRGRLSVFGVEDNRLRQQEADSGAPEWVDLDAYLGRIRTERGQNWILWTTRTEIRLHLDSPANPPAELPNLIQAALSSFGRVRVESTPNGYEAVFPRENGRLAKLRQALAGFVNRRLEPMVFVQVRNQNAPAAPPARRGGERGSRPVPPPPPVGYGSLADLDAAVDQAFKPRPAK